MNDVVDKVSVHGGHSGQFCQHARDSLEEVVRAYAEQGFRWVGLTEHMPPPGEAERYPDEVAAGLSAAALQQRFEEYFALGRRLQAEYRGRLEILLAFETEAYAASLPWVRELVERLRPDYLVGSVHHVADICIDYSADEYARAVAACGGLEALYCSYFDAQYALLRELEPAVVGHFDLVRIFDPDFRVTLALPAVAERVRRNLDFIRDKDLILDFNLRGFHKGEEQYPCREILLEALRLGIAVVPGDDSHGVASVGKHFERGVEVLRELGAPLHWRKPARIRY